MASLHDADGVQTLPAPFDLLRPGRMITGWSAVLLAHDDDGNVDWTGFERLVERTLAAGLVPTVNMDTGYANLIDERTRTEVLRRARALAGPGGFAAGAFVADEAGDPFDADGYAAQIDAVAEHGATPVVFQSHGLTSLDDASLVEAYRGFAVRCDAFVAFELSTAFAPFGAIYDLEVYRALLGIDACIGAKHSSLRRQPEWDRLRLRDELRPEFAVFTGNDLAIDMVMFGSDYLLGLSAFAPDAFAARDRAWAQNDPGFFELNDVLQALGAFAFRAPTPAYKHSAAQFLALRGWLESDAAHPDAAHRPDSDVAVLATFVERLAELGFSTNEGGR